MKYIIKILLIAFTLFIFYSIDIVNAGWYEESPVYETKNLNDMWWLSRKQKQAEKQKQETDIKKKIEENNKKEFKEKNIKWLYSDSDITRFPKDKWEIIDEDNDGIAYNYYFDKDGYLYIGTITPDYKIVDDKGREIDSNFQPIKYLIKGDNVNEKIVEVESIEATTKEPSKVILAKGVVLKNKEKLYDSSIDKNLNNYIEKADRYLKETKGTINNEVRWKNCSSLKGNGGFVIFINPNNNFNKVTGILAAQYSPYEDDATYTLNVYDQDEYDKYEEYHHFYELKEIYENDISNKIDAVKFSFTFDRSIKRLRFEIETNDEYNSRTCYFKDLRFGFSKVAYKEELIRKIDDEEEINHLKELGIYIDSVINMEFYDEDDDSIYDDEEHENENNDGRIGGISYISDEETKNYEDVLRDRNTGPAFDESLQDLKEIGPGIIINE